MSEGVSFILSLPGLLCLFLLKVGSVYLEKTVFSRLLACNKGSAAPVLWSKTHGAEHTALGASISSEHRLVV